LRAGIAHLWLVTIHPFEDGNGRIARAVTDLILLALSVGVLVLSFRRLMPVHGTPEPSASS